ncbi:MAG: hypothetical protein COY19_07000 [Candidatus Marinimicrobia bacterium CG_4_10_14_0_2_um_filter_48_9]|nr:MAG: hypothetical protein COY19_07000 [Candidatus Marinimicrobia bacterium CG_4_10_14_0_2_um_filter_48_9]
MGKIKRGGYVFFSWIGDHNPRHVHVYKDGNFIVKWDIENWQAMKGEAPRTILKLIRELMDEGKL